LTCDIVVASEKARFSCREINWGAIPIETLLRGAEILGKRTIAHLALTGETIDASEAKSLGLVNKVVPHEGLAAEVKQLCDKLKSGPPLAQQTIKRVLNRQSYEDYELSKAIMPAIFATEDMAEARKAFLEKRKPQFTGR
jgi:enoyl-CoA hydratase/carnithine racemase